MWSSGRTGFAEVPCPQGQSCTFPNCVFRHQAPPPQPPTTTASQTPGLAGPESAPDPGSRPESRLPVAPSGPSAPSVSSAPSAPSAKSAPFAKSIPSTQHSSSPNAATARTIVHSDKPVSLTPHPLQKAPVGFPKRLVLLRALHAALKVHNDKIVKAKDPDIRALHLNQNQLNQLAIDEELEIATSHPSVYENILKQRLVKLKSMSPEVWVKERRAAIAPKDNGTKDNGTKTGLSPKDEVTYVRTMKCDLNDLIACKYVTRLPSDAEVNEARLTLDAAAGWEMCDRCSTRFQVFPDRNEEGKLTTGGECWFHWGKRSTSDKYPCCGRSMWDKHCTRHDTHVFSHKDPNSLSLVMPFICTPPNGNVPKFSAVSCDCEMGYTTNGFEMLRLTVLSWPQHEPLVDVLVRPFGTILDFNTRFSGVTKDQFVNAKAYDPANPRPVGKELRIVESPYAARDLFLSHVSPETPIIGHGLENDLKVLRLIHPTIVDTAILFKTKRPLPFRLRLRDLARDNLNQEIQQAGEAGHDSHEDARAAGELVRLKVKKLWAIDEQAGFTIRDDAVHPPLPTVPQPAVVHTSSMTPTANMTGSMTTMPGNKRKHEGKEGEGNITEPLRKKAAQMPENKTK